MTGSSDLRARKRTETRDRLEQVATELVKRDGFAHVTIDAIAEGADVSPRTFFNYFETKEDAVLGISHLDEVPDSSEDPVAPGGDAIESVVRMLFATMGRSVENATKHAERLDLIRQNPQLIARQFSHMERLIEGFVARIRTLLQNDPGFGPAEVDNAKAELVFGLCGSAVRIAMREWMSAGTTFSATEIEERAISLTREIVNRLK
jgi:AcrR family transcriptional regulator